MLNLYMQELKKKKEAKIILTTMGTRLSNCVSVNLTGVSLIIPVMVQYCSSTQSIAAEQPNCGATLAGTCCAGSGCSSRPLPVKNCCFKSRKFFYLFFFFILSWGILYLDVMSLIMTLSLILICRYYTLL